MSDNEPPAIGPGAAKSRLVVLPDIENRRIDTCPVCALIRTLEQMDVVGRTRNRRPSLHKSFSWLHRLGRFRMKPCFV
jgi:hypothetical protein